MDLNGKTNQFGKVERGGQREWSKRLFSSMLTSISLGKGSPPHQSGTDSMPCPLVFRRFYTCTLRESGERGREHVKFMKTHTADIISLHEERER